MPVKKSAPAVKPRAKAAARTPARTAAKTAAKTPAKTAARTAAKPTAKTAAKPAATARGTSAAAGGAVPKRFTLAETMAALEKAGSAQTRKTYLRHGAKEPLFGVRFGTLQELYKRIKVDHELACALWATGNFDARNLAMKVADPARLSEADLDEWARGYGARMCSAYVAALASEGPHGLSRAHAWLASADADQRAAGWALVGVLAMRDEATPDAWFLAHLATIEKGIHAAPNDERGTMNQALISIGGRNAALRRAALAAAKRIGPVEVDHGDTACKTPVAAEYLDKMWTYATSKGHDSPAAQERKRESMRLRC